MLIQADETVQIMGGSLRTCLWALSDTQLSYHLYEVLIRYQSDTTSRYTIIVLAAFRPRALDVIHGMLVSMYESLPCAVRTLRGLCALCLSFALHYTTYEYESIQTRIYFVWTYDNHTKRCSNHRFDIRRKINAYSVSIYGHSHT